MEMMQGRQVAGILLSAISASDTVLNGLEDMETPIVLFDQVVEGYQGSSVSFDFFKGGYMAAEYLLKQGNKKLAFASPAMDRSSRKLIYDGYKQAIKDSGIRCSSMKVLLSAGVDEDAPGDYDYRNGVLLAEALLKKRYLPDAVLAVNDMAAIGIINTLSDHGIQVPADISVMGFDNIAVSGMISPPLTTIDQPAYRTGELAAGILLDWLLQGKKEPKKIKIEPELVERKSVRKIHAKIKG